MHLHLKPTKSNLLANKEPSLKTLSTKEHTMLRISWAVGTFLLLCSLLLQPLYASPKEGGNITLVLDWTPNTNHTGIVVAKELGFYEQEGINLKIIQPNKNSAELLTAQNYAQFGISSESSLLEALGRNLPVISVAAIIAHDTSGFYSLKQKNIKTPKDFEGKTYGGWGSDFEIATIKAMMGKSHADFSKLKIVTIGTANFFTAKNIDFVWGFEAWTGCEAAVEKIPVNYVPVRSSLNIDGYTPIIIANTKFLKLRPNLASRFLKATTRGYMYAIAHPQEAASILLKKYPELNRALVYKSQAFLASHYRDASKEWGYQDKIVWSKYQSWMLKQKVIKQPFKLPKIFTNEFLPRSNRNNGRL